MPCECSQRMGREAMVVWEVMLTRVCTMGDRAPDRPEVGAMCDSHRIADYAEERILSMALAALARTSDTSSLRVWLSGSRAAAVLRKALSVLLGMLVRSLESPYHTPRSFPASHRRL